MRFIALSSLLLSLAACSTGPAKDSSTENATTTEAAKPAAVAISNTFDPVCGMPITAADATGYADYEGKKLGFCSEGCAEEFKKDPAQFAAKIK